MGTRRIWTIGHSNRPSAEVVALLTNWDIRMLADVRRFPGSKRQPQFAQDHLAATLRDAGIGYRHFEALGGRRSRLREGSPNTAWKNAGFNAYADYMLSVEFESALVELMILAADTPTVVMCAEAVPWRCHRQLIADAVNARGWEVRHILGLHQVWTHRLTEFAKVSGTLVTYPGGALF